MPKSWRLRVGLCSLGLFLVSCEVRDSPTGVGQGALVSLGVQPALIPSAADASALPVNRIRAVVSGAADGSVLADERFDVSPTASSWTIQLRFPLGGEAARIVVVVLLLNVAGDGTEEVQFSGRVGPLDARAGGLVTVADVDIVRGPLGNLDVTGVTVTAAPDTLEVGESAALAASVTAAPGASPRLFWTSLAPSVVAMADSVASGVSPGRARVVASAGRHADTVEVVVIPVRVASVLVSPDSADVEVGSTRPYTVVLRDARGAVLTGRAVVWQTLDTTVATVNASGVVTGVRPGLTRVRATSEGVSDEAVVRVTPLPGAGGGTVTWTRGSSGLWSDPANWTPARVPQAGDTVMLTQGGDYTVLLDVDATVERVVVGGAADLISLIVDGRTLAITGTGTEDPGLEIRRPGRVEIRRQGSVSVTYLSNDGTVLLSGAGTIEAQTVTNGGSWIVAPNSVATMLPLSSQSLGMWLYSGSTLMVEEDAVLWFRDGQGARFLGYSGGTIEGSGAVLFEPGSRLVLREDLEVDGPHLLFFGGEVYSNPLRRLTIGPGSVAVVAGTSPVELTAKLTVQGFFSASGTAVYLADTLRISRGGSASMSADVHSVTFRTGEVENAGVIWMDGYFEVAFGPGAGGRIANLGVIATGNTGNRLVLDGELRNEGLIHVQGSTELRRRTSAGDEVTASHRNDGTIRVIGGETSFEIVLGGASSTFTNAHTVELIQGGTLSVTNVATPAGAVINTPTGLLMGSGTVRFRPGGSYPDPTGVNNGTIAPGVAGVPGALQWEGSLHMGETGVIDIELQGRIPGVEHDQINVTRDLVLGSGMPAGRLVVTSPDFSPPMGTRYPVLTFRSRVGAFADIDLIAGSTLDTVWVSGQGADTLYLEVIDGPPPTSDVWTWMGGSPERDRPGQWGSPGVPSVTNIPSARPFAAVWALPSQQTTDVWLFGGFGRDVQGLNGALGDLWHFDGAAWTWVGGPNLANAPPVHGERGIANESNHPGGRFGAATWVDASGNLWLFGGRTNQGAVFSSGTLRNDLWRYDRQTRSWTWVSGSSSTNASGVYGSQGVPDPANVPGARAYAVSWIDSTGNLWLFGGRDPSGAVYNDLWRFDVGSGTWTWIKGSASVNRPGEYGARGVPDAANTPGARSNALAWVDRFGDFWLFGGLSGQSDYFNDLWRFDGTDWTWVSGADTTNEPGAYGARGVASAANVPGARSSRAAWVDASGDVWLFGGFGYAAQGSAGYLNDLWRFDGSSWAWISGAQTTNEAGSYSETPGERGVNYRPGARSAVAAWTGPAGSFWLFGGSGYDGSGLLGPLNDVWRYEP